MIIFLILLFSAILRFYNLPNNFVFGGDEEHQAILAQTIIKDFHIIWIGVNAGNLGFYLGPYWTYFTSFWLMLSKGDPLITGYVASAIGVFTNFLIIIVGSKLFNKKVGLLAGLLYASLPLMVFFDQKYWNPTLIPFLSLLMLLSLSQTRRNQYWFVIFSASFASIFHVHLSLFPIIFVAIFYLIKEKIKLSKQVIFLSTIIVILILAPLITFDYFHKGSNITTPFRLREIASQPESKINPVSHLDYFFQTMGRVWFIKPFSNNSDEILAGCQSKRFESPFFLSLIGLGILLAFLINILTWKNKNTLLLALFIISISTSFLFFPGSANEYYLLGIFPLLLFLPGILNEYFPKFKYFSLLGIFLVSGLGVYTIFTNISDYGLAAKLPLIKQTIATIDNQPFELKQVGYCHYYEGWRYLFILNGKKPERADSDKSLGWLYDKEITNNPTKYTVILSEKRIPINFLTKDAKVIESGGFNSYIFTNY